MDEFHKPFITTFAETEAPFTTFDTFWIPCSAKFISLGSTNSATGVIHIYEINGGKIELVKKKEHEKSFKCGTFGASSITSRHLATGDFCGNLDIWDLENSFTPIYSVKGHKDIIYSIDGIAGRSANYGAPEIVTGGLDGLVKVWDPRQKDKPVAIMESKGDHKRDCWAVTFGNSYNSQERVVCAGYDNGDIKMFDLKTMSVRWETNLPNGICSLEFDRKDIEMNKFVATCLEGSLSLFITRNKYNDFPSISKNAHNSTVWCGKHLPQNREIFMTCGGSGSLCLWKYSYCSDDMNSETGSLKLIQENSVSHQSIIGFDWCPDKIGLAVCCSLDQVIRLLIVSQLNHYSL